MRLLIVGKLHGHIGTASKIALKRGAQVVQVDTVEAALESLRSGKGADMLMIDVALDIETLCQSLHAERITVPVVGCGIGTDAQTAVKAIRAGAKEYIPLPPDSELIAGVIETVARQDDTLVFRDPVMQSVMRLAEQIAPSEASVLIIGESGTGKEIMARFIHQHSRRKARPFISINCAAIPENLLESELFGHEKGAFTGAVARRVGKFEEASGGTLLLDEVTEMHPSLQAKLLRAIQEREIDRVGGTKPVKVDIRILATSNRNMEEAVRAGIFREDLYFRLNVVTIALPALRQRPLDIEPLAEHFIQKYAQMNGVALRFLSDGARSLLRQHPWRGNIRELENAMHRAVLLASADEIGVDVLQLSGIGAGQAAPSSPQQASATQTEGFQKAFIGRSISDVERDLILGTLGHCLGNRTQAANLLGISIRTLRNKLRLYMEEDDAPGESLAAPSPYRAAGM
ncbi:MAG: sigma-54 dependent transcriptional regulator [Proteobacteria bacterium]|nr:sigma-54 dependent transcriptional regulator [Pseudomonadota bacterium]